MTSKIAWKIRMADRAWSVVSSPFTIGIYIALATVFAFVASAKTGIPAYMLMAVGFLLVIFVDPPERLSNLRARRRRSSQASRIVNIRGPRSDGNRRETVDDRGSRRQ